MVTEWHPNHGERLAGLERDVQRLGSDLHQIEGQIGQLKQVLDSTSRVTEHAVNELQQLNRDANSALVRVGAIETSISNKLIADKARLDDRDARNNRLRVIIGVMASVLGALAVVSKGWLDAIWSLLKLFGNRGGG